MDNNTQFRWNKILAMLLQAQELLIMILLYLWDLKHWRVKKVVCQVSNFFVKIDGNKKKNQVYWYETQNYLMMLLEKHVDFRVSNNWHH